MKKVSFIKGKKCAGNARNSFIMTNIRKANLDCTKKSEIIFTTSENLEELLIIFVT